MSKAKEIRDLEISGQGLYKARKYTDALDAFSKAIVLAQKWSPSDVLAILDQRLMTHKHLGNIDLARKDAKSMIRADKANARGYLRCAQLDRREDNLSAALQWCEHGLKHVPSRHIALKHVTEDDSWRSVLVAQRDKVEALIQQKIMASKARDPLSILPAELFQHVFMYLDYRETVKALRVSRAWMGTVSRFKLLSDTVDFSGAQCLINYKMTVAALKRLGANPKKLIMTQLSGPAEALLLKNLIRWHNYTQLETLTISPNVFSKSILPFARYNLRSLDLEGGEISEIMIMEVLMGCRSLEVGRFPQARGSLGFSGSVDDVYHQLCRTLRSLHLGGKRFDNRVGWERYASRVDPELLAAFPRLEELVCENFRIMPASDVQFDLSGVTGLRRLVLKSCAIRAWPTLPPNVEVWDNYDIELDCYRPFPMSYWDGRSIGELGKLKCLRFNKTFAPPPIFAFMPKESTSSITALDIRNTPIDCLIGTSFLAAFLPHLTHVRELAWGGVQREEDVTLPLLGRLEELETLSLSASQFHGSDLMTLLKRPENRLKSIMLTDCENISPDTVDWARSRGLTVQVKKSQVV